MRNHTTFFLILAFLIALGGCTITHKFGPYSGRVVDAKTGEPIEGALVLIGFYTKGTSVGGSVTRFADAVEVFTDANGEFKIPQKRITLFRAMQIWDKDCDLLIFKPGYGSYPRHRGTSSSEDYDPYWAIPENIHVIFYLPKLTTIEARKDNLWNVTKPAGITNNKMPHLIKLEREERVNVGLSP